MTASGFIGLGNMGGRMSRRLVDSGTEVLGFDMVAENVTSAGAQPAESVANVVSSCDVVFISLPSSQIIEPLLIGSDEVLGHIRPGQILVDLSTSEPDSTERISAAVADRGAQYLDAGISGGAAAAEKGQLTLMVGGAANALETVRPYLETFSAKVFHVGDSGTGHAAKLLNNFLNAVALSATSEVMVAAKKAGLDLEVLLDVLNHSSGVNFATLNRFPKIIHGDYLKGGLTNTLMLKDVIAYTKFTSALGTVNLHSSGPTAAFGVARQLGYADEISNTVVDALGDLSGGVRLHENDHAEAPEEENPS